MELPYGVATTQLGVVKTVGLDLEKGPHKVVWSALSENRTKDSAPLKYERTVAEECFPPRKLKPDRQTGVTEEAYIPPGILKANWMEKHGKEIPSVVVIFIDLEWEDPNWTEEEEKCANLLNELRSHMMGRATRIVVVLLQRALMSEGGDIVDKRAVTFRTACGLNTKSSLFVLHSAAAGLKGMVIRLENAFLELSKQFYSEQQTRVRSQVELLNQTTEIFMFIRYTFKIAFYHELRQELGLALKEYRQAYRSIRSISLSSHHLHELKVVSGIINLKICQCLFRTKAPMDAVKQFAQHITFYKRIVGDDSVAFLHYGTLAEQYAAFGEIFEAAIDSKSIAAIQTEHPGMYYRVAAQNTLQRQKECKRLCTSPKLKEIPNPKRIPAVYLGQDLVVSDDDDDSILVADPERYVLLLCATELDYPFCDIGLKLFQKARDLHLTYNLIQKDDKDSKQLVRFVEHINVEISNLLITDGRHEDAIRYLESACELFRKECWSSLLTRALQNSLRCHYYLGSMKEYTSICFELSGRSMSRSEEDRQRTWSNFTQVLEGHVPQCEPSTVAQDDLWKEILSKNEIQLPLDITLLSGTIGCKVQFTDFTLPTSSTITLAIVLYSGLPAPVTLTEVVPLFDHEVYKGIKLEISEQAPITLQPLEKKVLAITFKSPLQRAHTLVCTGARARIAPKESRFVDCSWTLFGVEDHVKPISVPLLKACDWHNVETKNSLEVTQEKPKVSIDVTHPKPALVGERYPITIVVKNKESFPIREVVVKAAILGETPKGGLTFADDGDLATRQQHKLEDMKAGDEVTIGLWSQTKTATELSLRITLEYNDGTDVRVLSRKEKTDVVIPFEVIFRVQTMQLSRTKAEKLTAGDRFLLLPELKSSVPFPIILKECNLIESAHNRTFKYHGVDAPTPLSNVSLLPGEVGGDCCCLRAPMEAGKIPLGVYAVSWARTDTSKACETLYALPSVDLDMTPITLSVDVATTTTFGEPLALGLNMKNNTDLVQEVEVLVAPTDGFMFTGPQRMRVRLLPQEPGTSLAPTSLHYDLYPLTTGAVTLPSFAVTDVRKTTLIAAKGPAHVFVLPRSQQPTTEEAVLVSI